MSISDVDKTATQERKRERRAASSPAALNLQSSSCGLGCSLALLAYLGICWILFTASGSLIFVLLGLPAVLVGGSSLFRFLYGLALLLAVRWRWRPRGIRCLVVHSHSPNWEAHIRDIWMPRLGNVATTLNWSERASWKPSLAVRIFRHFCGRTDFNPVVVVFQGLEHPLVFRFYQAFKQVKAGRPQYLERLEGELFTYLDAVDRDGPGLLR